LQEHLQNGNTQSKHHEVASALRNSNFKILAGIAAFFALVCKIARRTTEHSAHRDGFEAGGRKSNQSWQLMSTKAWRTPRAETLR
jgi:hypothetical protein